MIHRLEAHGASYSAYADGKVGRCMTVGRPYEVALLEHIYAQRFGGLAVDAGAHIGNHTLWMAVVCRLKVAAFEPLVHQALDRNIALNGLRKRVRTWPVALGAQRGRARMSAKGELSMGGGELTMGDGDIPVCRLDDCGLANVALIKADVEGFEEQVFAGGEQTIRRDRPVIYAEERAEGRRQAIADVLEPWGYRMTQLFASKSVPTPVGEWRCA